MNVPFSPLGPGYPLSPFGPGLPGGPGMVPWAVQERNHIFSPDEATFSRNTYISLDSFPLLYAVSQKSVFSLLKKFIRSSVTLP